MWSQQTPCREYGLEVFGVRHGGESHQAYISRIGFARSICNLQCSEKAACAQYAVMQQVTGVCAGLMFQQGEVKRWPEKRKETPIRSSECCMECGDEYVTQKQSPLCPSCRRKDTLFWGGDSIGGEGPSASGGCGFDSEAA